MSLINDTLEMSKLENEETKISKEDFYLPDLLHEVETIAQMMADKECITIHFMDDPYSIPYPKSSRKLPACKTDIFKSDYKQY